MHSDYLAQQSRGLNRRLYLNRIHAAASRANWFGCKLEHISLSLDWKLTDCTYWMSKLDYWAGLPGNLERINVDLGGNQKF
jgi:hypothetical protein